MTTVLNSVGCLFCTFETSFYTSGVSTVRPSRVMAREIAIRWNKVNRVPWKRLALVPETVVFFGSR